MSLREFTVRRIYLDANGSCPAIAEAKEIIKNSLDFLGNPSSFHEHGRIVRQKIDEARLHVASAIGAREKEIIFTSGASEANRLFVDALIKQSITLSKKLNVIMSPFEHPSLLKPVMEAKVQGHFNLRILEIDQTGKILAHENELRNCDVLIACQAHNETGILVDIEALTALVPKETIIMSDISQGFARMAPPTKRVDVMSFSAQKMGGFAGIGGLVLRNNAKKLVAPWVGGGQERGFRPGTEGLLLIMAFGVAAKFSEHLRKMHHNIGELRDYFERELSNSADIKIIGIDLPRLPNTSATCFLNQDPDALRIACDMAGLSVGFGAACSGLAPEGSFLLKRLSLSLAEERTTVRFSFPPDITEEDVKESIDRLKHLVLTHRSLA